MAASPMIMLVSPSPSANPYEAVRARLKRQDRRAAQTRYGVPFLPFIAKALMWGLVGGLLGYAIGGWKVGLVLSVGRLLLDIGMRLWVRRRSWRRADGNDDGGRMGT